MNNAFSQMVSIIIAVIIMCFMPLCFLYGRIDNLRQIYVLTETEYFIDSICNTGFVSKEMYDGYIRAIGNKGAVYEVDITRETPVYTLTDTGYELSKDYYGNEEIVSEIEESGRYYFSQGDFVRAQVKKVSDINVFSIFGNEVRECYYGGQIKYEAY